MDLSVIIPCHNIGKYIPPLLESFNSQNLSQYKVELIFIFDACTDDTRKVVEEILPFSPPYEAIHLINADVKSCGFARNVGLEIASGKYVWFIDGDDWLLNDNAMSTCIRLLEKYNSPLIQFSFDYPDTFKFGTSPVMVWQYCYNRELIGTTRFLPIQPSEDVAFNKEIFRKIGNNKILVIKAKLYYYNYGREGSNMQQLTTTGVIKP